MAADRGAAPDVRGRSLAGDTGPAGAMPSSARRHHGGILATYTRRSLVMNRVRTAVTVVGVALACALFLAVGVSALSVFRYLGEVARATSGAYNGAATGVDAAFVARAAEEPGVTRTAWLCDEGYARIDTASTLTPYLHVVGMPAGEQAAQDLTYLTSLRLTQGRMPQDASEVILPQSLVDAGALKARVGGQITLEVGTRRADDGSTLGWADQTRQQAGDAAGVAEELTDVAECTFTVVGFYADTPALIYAAGMAGSYVAGYPAITVADPAVEQAAAQGASPQAQVGGASEKAGEAYSDEDAPSFQLWLTVSDASATMEVLARIADGAEAGGGSGLAADPAADAGFPYEGCLIYENDNVNRATSLSLNRGAYVTLVGFAAVTCTIVVVASALLIRNAFAISVTQRTRQFGLLSSVGATARQLRGLVLREALAIDVIAIPLGVLVGCLGSAVVLTAAREAIMGGLSGGVEGVELSVAITPWLVLVAATLALLTTLLSAWGPARRAARMTAVDAIRSSRDVRIPSEVRRGGRVMGYLFGVGGLLAARSFRRDARPRRAVSASLVTAVTLVVSATLLGAYAQAYLGAVTPDVSGEFGRGYDLAYTFTEANVDADDEGLTPQAIAERLGDVDGVDESAYALTLDAFGTRVRVGEGATPADAFDPDYLATLTGEATGVTLQFVDDGTYRAWLEEQGLPADELMDAEHPRAVAVNKVRLNDGSRYRVLTPLVRAGFPLSASLETIEGLTGEAGEGVGENAGAAGDASSAVELAVEVGALADEVPWWVGVPEGLVFLLPLSAVQTVAPQVVDAAGGSDLPARTWSVWFQASDAARAQTAITGVLQDVGLSPARLTNLALQRQSQASTYLTAQIFLWAFAAIVTLIALAGAFNAMYTSVTLRRRELAMLRSCGLTARGVRRELLCECLLHTGRVALWAVPVALLVSAALWASLGRTLLGASYVLPWGVVPALAVVLLVMLAAGLLALRSSRADELVSILRTEAI